MFKSLLRISCFAACWVFANSSVAQPDSLPWPQFRGPRGDGYVQRESELPTSWGGILDEPHWTAEPGVGWSSPIVAAGQVWVTVAESTALDDAAQKKRLLATRYSDDVDLQADASVSLYLVAMNVRTGKQTRRQLLFQHDDPAPIHATNNYASPTPVTDGKTIFCHFGAMGTAAVSVEREEVLWRKTISIDDISGPAVSPILANGRLILVCDGCERQELLALEPSTGAVAWRTPRPAQPQIERQYRRSFCTPLVVRHGKRQLLIAPTSNWALGYEPETGRELWRAKLPVGHAIVPRPVYDSDSGLVFVSSGFYKSTLVAIDAGGDGDVTQTHIRWKTNKQAPHVASPAIHKGRLYMVSDRGVASCLKAESGELLWQQRLKGSFAASPLVSDNKLYFFGREGTTTVIRPGAKFEMLAENRLYGEFMATPAVANGMLLLRGGTKLFAIRAE